MDTETQEQQITRIIEDCEVYWLLRNVPRVKVDDMRLELEQHLRDAARDGKPLEAVIDGEVEDFAEAWADENRQNESLGGRLLGFSSTFTNAAASIFVLRHVLELTPSFSLDLWTLIVVLVLTVTAEALLRRPLARPVFFGPPWQRLLVGLGIGGLLVGSGIAWSLAGSGANPVLFTWPWYATLVLAGAAFVLLRLAVRNDPTAPAQRSSPTGR